MKRSELRQIIREELNQSQANGKRLNESWTHKGLYEAIEELSVQFKDAQAQYRDDEGEEMAKDDVKEINEMIDKLYSKLAEYFG